MKQPTGSYLIALLILSVGLVSGYFSFKNLYQHIHLLNSGVVTTGQVIDVEYQTKKGTTSSSPTVQFTTTDGQLQEYTAPVFTNMVNYEEGQSIQLHYNPKDPTQVILDRGGWVQTLFPMPFFLCFGGLGGYILWWLLRERRRNRRLDEVGQLVEGAFAGTTANFWGTKHKVNWTNPTTKQTHEFKINEELIPDEHRTIGKKIPVLIDPDNPVHYYRVELEQV
jgi:hypothetical protein